MKTRACTRTVINIYDFLIYSENRTSYATATTDLSTLIFVHTVFLASFPLPNVSTCTSSSRKRAVTINGESERVRDAESERQKG